MFLLIAELSPEDQRAVRGLCENPRSGTFLGGRKAERARLMALELLRDEGHLSAELLLRCRRYAGTSSGCWVQNVNPGLNPSHKNLLPPKVLKSPLKGGTTLAINRGFVPRFGSQRAHGVWGPVKLGECLVVMNPGSTGCPERKPKRRRWGSCILHV